MDITPRQALSLRESRSYAEKRLNVFPLFFKIDHFFLLVFCTNDLRYRHFILLVVSEEGFRYIITIKGISMQLFAFTCNLIFNFHSKLLNEQLKIRR